MIALGWGVKMCAEKQRRGKILGMATGGWTCNNASYPGYKIPPAVEPTHDALLTAGLAWLAGHAGSAHVLIFGTNPPVYGESFGADFQAALTRLGHTFVLTGSTGGGSPDWGGYDPKAFDCVFADYAGHLTDEQWDAYLDSDGAALWWCEDVNGVFRRYGFMTSGYMTSGVAPNYLVSCNAGPLGTVAHVSLGATKFAAEAQTMPGTTTLYPNADGDLAFALWER